MEQRHYAVLSILGVLIIMVSGILTSMPLDVFLVDGFTRMITTVVTMVWITWWALVLGFMIAGGVEAWVSSERIASTFEGASPSDIAIASVLGFISSSCSYSAIATAKNLFKKGASAAAALGAFMFASTNLVIEIGFVIWLLLGWQFVVANYVGGIVLIVLMAVFFTYVVPDSIIETARSNIPQDDTVTDPVCGMDVSPSETDYSITHNATTYYFCSESCRESFSPENAVEEQSLYDNITSKQGWVRLAEKQWSEWMMLWKEIAVGFLFAGLIAGFVPETVWISLFGQQAFGFPLALIWGAIIGAVIGIATFVCSVGNVPFAVVLWAGGLPFGGVFSYIYADLIVPPIVEAYREYYGRTFASVLTVVIFISAVLSGIITHLIFLWSGLIPDPSTATLTGNEIALDHKAILNLVATIVFIVLFSLQNQNKHTH